MGVRRAMELALDASHTRQGPIYSYGPLIHNPQALELLKTKGVDVLDAERLEKEHFEGGTVIIRAHGVPPEERDDLSRKGFEIIDATCPRVIKVQSIIKKHANDGYTPIIWGNPSHPEVIGLAGYAAGKGLVIEKAEDVDALPDSEKVILAAQTTQNVKKFDEIVNAVKKRWPDVKVFNTICGATQKRQDEVRKLACDVQAMVVVGGHSSGNTARLAAVAREEGVKTIHIETEDELDPEWIGDDRTIGVTAGASTPNWMIKRVIRKLERISRKTDVSLRTVSHRILRALILSNVYAAFGAGLLCLAGSMLQGLKADPVYFGVAFFFVHAMHMMNLFLDKEASKFNDPDRVLFMEKHKGILFASAVFSGLASLVLAVTLCMEVFILLIFMSIMGLLYAVPFVPKALSDRFRIRRLKDIPSSKTLATSAGWAVIVSFIPPLAVHGWITWSTVFVAAVVCMMVFVRSALGDILDIQGDRIVGRETIPIIIGEKNTWTMLNAINATSAIMLIIGWASGLLTTLALPLLVCPVYAAFYLTLFKREQFVSSTFFEAFIDGNFILAGLLSWFWGVI